MSNTTPWHICFVLCTLKYLLNPLASLEVIALPSDSDYSVSATLTPSSPSSSNGASFTSLNQVTQTSYKSEIGGTGDVWLLQQSTSDNFNAVITLDASTWGFINSADTTIAIQINSPLTSTTSMQDLIVTFAVNGKYFSILLDLGNDEGNRIYPETDSELAKGDIALIASTDNGDTLRSKVSESTSFNSDSQTMDPTITNTFPITIELDNTRSVSNTLSITVSASSQRQTVQLLEAFDTAQDIDIYLGNVNTEQIGITSIFIMRKVETIDWISTTSSPTIVSYHLIPELLSFMEASKYCTEICDSELASVHSDDDFMTLSSVLDVERSYMHSRGINVWIGLQDYTTEGTFVNMDATDWDYGTDLSGGQYPWDVGYPDDEEHTKNCVSVLLVIGQTDDRWVDDECDTSWWFVCNECVTDPQLTTTETISTTTNPTTVAPTTSEPTTVEPTTLSPTILTSTTVVLTTTDVATTYSLTTDTPITTNIVTTGISTEDPAATSQSSTTDMTQSTTMENSMQSLNTATTDTPITTKVMISESTADIVTTTISTTPIVTTTEAITTVASISETTNTLSATDSAATLQSITTDMTPTMENSMQSLNTASTDSPESTSITTTNESPVIDDDAEVSNDISSTIYIDLDQHNQIGENQAIVMNQVLDYVIIVLIIISLCLCVFVAIYCIRNKKQTDINTNNKETIAIETDIDIDIEVQKNPLHSQNAKDVMDDIKEVIGTYITPGPVAGMVMRSSPNNSAYKMLDNEPVELELEGGAHDHNNDDENQAAEGDHVTAVPMDGALPTGLGADTVIVYNDVRNDDAASDGGSDAGSVGDMKGGTVTKGQEDRQRSDDKYGYNDCEYDNNDDDAQSDCDNNEKRGFVHISDNMAIPMSNTTKGYSDKDHVQHQIDSRCVLPSSNTTKGYSVHREHHMNVALPSSNTTKGYAVHVHKQRHPNVVLPSSNETKGYIMHKQHHHPDALLPSSSTTGM